MKNQKGVSLITLVITIIVVIILAAIALTGGATDSIAEANYAGFANEMGALQEAMTTSISTTKGKLGIAGDNRSDAQIINYLARGGSEVLKDSGDVSGEAMWLTKADASSIPCTEINSSKAKTTLGMSLPDRKVETAKSTNQQLSYFVTNEGVVFCWPPFEYDGKAYVAPGITVNKLSSVEATSGEQTFTVGSKPITVNNTTGTAISFYTKNSGDVGNAASVIYNLATGKNTISGGVAAGYDFSKYNNGEGK